ncbi:MAG: type IX secretion system protein PorQ [Ignavibacteriaceae bacterium]|nr:type IX secretion system protein PorQ [Ignavibacteriaceae bacterium]
MKRFFFDLLHHLTQLVVISFISITIANAQNNTYEFLRVGMSPRAAALGGSFVAATDDPDVIFYNPAGIYTLPETPVSFSYVNHLLDINLASLSVTKNIEGIGKFGASVQYINYGTFPRTDEYANKNGEFGAGEVAFSAAYAGLIDENFVYGTNVKFIYSGIAEYSSTAIGMDIGLQYLIPEENFSLGFAVSNIGTQLSKYISSKEELPLDISLGVSKRLLHLPLRFFVDFHKLNENQNKIFNRLKNFSAGGEFTLSKVLKLRAGFDNEKRTELKVGNFAGLAGFAVGLGITIKDYQFSYAFSSMGQIGALHRIGLNTNF